MENILPYNDLKRVIKCMLFFKKKKSCRTSASRQSNQIHKNSSGEVLYIINLSTSDETVKLFAGLKTVITVIKYNYSITKIHN